LNEFGIQNIESEDGVEVNSDLSFYDRIQLFIEKIERYENREFVIYKILSRLYELEVKYNDIYS